MARCLFTWVIVLCLSAAAYGQGARTYDRYGGWTGIQGQRTGFFHTQYIDRRWWLVSPEGNVFFLKGVCAARFAGDLAPALGHSPYQRSAERIYGDAGRWAEATVVRLRAWGLNTAGAWSGEEMERQSFARTLILHLADAARPKSMPYGDVPDVFDPAFAVAVDRAAEKQCAPRRDDPWLVGYFTDNELRWRPDWRGGRSVLEVYLTMDRSSPGRQRAEAFMAERGQAAAVPGDEDREAFLELAAGEYFRITTAAIRRHDPNHLILGCRLAGAAPRPVLKAMRGQVDVVSINDYDPWPPVGLLAEISEITAAPTLISEFSFKARDSGLPNTKGAGKPLATQLERAEATEQYLLTLARLPSCVGYQWFQYHDQPKEGRFDGENSNFGLVNGEDKPYDLLILRLRKANLQLERERAAWYPAMTQPATMPATRLGTP